MKVLQISSARSMGGGEKHVVDLSNELAKRGHDVFVAVVPGSPLRGALSQVPAENIFEAPLRNALDVGSVLRIVNFVRQHKVDVINVHLAKDYPIAAAASQVTKVPYVITRHVLFPMNRFHRVFLRNARYVVAPSSAVAESLREQGIFPPEKIVTIRYGLDVENFPIRDRKPHGDLCVGSIGNLDPVKGFDILIRAAAIVSKERPDVKFKIVGVDRSRDGRNEKELRSLIEESDSVELAGWSDNVAEVLAGLDVFVSSSRSESFGFVIAEAMLASVPVIATETEGAKEIISDAILGELVPVADSQALAAAITNLLSDDQRRNELSNHGRAHIVENFSLKRTVDETEELYAGLVRA